MSAPGQSSEPHLVGVFELRGQAVQTIGLFKRSQIFSLNILDQSNFKSLCVVSRFFDAGHFPQSGSARRVIAPFAGDQVVAILARHKPHQQRLQHALLAHRIGKFSQIADSLARLSGLGRTCSTGIIRPMAAPL